MTTESKNTPAKVDAQSIERQCEAVERSMTARGWPECRLCGEQVTRVDENGNCGDCRRQLRKKYGWVKRWTRSWWGGID